MTKYSLVFKNGDDMRQDQLILQIISVIDILLKEVNLDFKFTAFKVLAASNKDGVMEFVENSATVQKVQLEHNRDLYAFLSGLSDDPERRKDII